MAMIKGRVNLGREVVPRRISVGGESPYRELAGNQNQWRDARGNNVRTLDLAAFRLEASRIRGERRDDDGEREE